MIRCGCWKKGEVKAGKYNKVWQKILMSWLEVACAGQLAVNKSDLLSSPSMATTAVNWEQLIASLYPKMMAVRQVNSNPKALLILAPG